MECLLFFWNFVHVLFLEIACYVSDLCPHEGLSWAAFRLHCIFPVYAYIEGKRPRIDWRKEYKQGSSFQSHTVPSTAESPFVQSIVQVQFRCSDRRAIMYHIIFAFT